MGHQPIDADTRRPHHGSADFEIIARLFWGLGYATEAAAAAVRFGFQSLQLFEIVSNAGIANEKSMRVMAKLGCYATQTAISTIRGFRKGILCAANFYTDSYGADGRTVRGNQRVRSSPPYPVPSSKRVRSTSA
ncbi:GNAT family N-acetyltransferase [Caballeronia sp. NK8]|uniref:GNAT family N-acetyltransferase n=1 Tax=Caballeronia sp. NK8 TaxID=140098 RepID=UPI001CED457A|nr:GNAT family N-acetyltransferase [Caballeronia sp. NK8]